MVSVAHEVALCWTENKYHTSCKYDHFWKVIKTYGLVMNPEHGPHLVSPPAAVWRSSCAWCGCNLSSSVPAELPSWRTTNDESRKEEMKTLCDHRHRRGLKMRTLLTNNNGGRGPCTCRIHSLSAGTVYSFLGWGWTRGYPTGTHQTHALLHEAFKVHCCAVTTFKKLGK